MECFDTFIFRKNNWGMGAWELEKSRNGRLIKFHFTLDRSHTLIHNSVSVLTIQPKWK